MKNITRKTELFPKSSYLPCGILVFMHFAVYYGTKPLQEGLEHYSPSLPVDAMIPFRPEWALIYALTFFFWVICAMVLMLQERETCFRLFAGLGIAEIICAVFFIAYPTVMVRPEIQSTAYGAKLLSQFYSSDIPVNLFPSMHCMMSYMLFRDLMYCKNVKKPYVIVAGLFTALVCSSTFFVKQHYVLDSLSGIILGEVCVWLSMRTSVWKVFDRLERWLFKTSTETVNT